MARFLDRYRDNYAQFPSNAAIWLHPDGRPRQEGDWLVQTDLANALTYMADEESAARSNGGDRLAGLDAARKAFYEGDIARTITDYHAAHDGWLTMADMANYHTPVETPLSIPFNGATVYSCRPWCQGPTLLQMLRILDGIDLRALGHNSADYVHILAETIKLVFADRERYYGDPDVIDVPIEQLLSASHGAQRRAMIDPTESSLPPRSRRTSR